MPFLLNVMLRGTLASRAGTAMDFPAGFVVGGAGVADAGAGLSLTASVLAGSGVATGGDEAPRLAAGTGVVAGGSEVS